MNVIQILIFLSICLVYRLFLGKKWLDSILLVTCLLSLFWFQPISTIRTLDFWIPTLSIAFGFISWLIVVKQDNNNKENVYTGMVVFAILLIIGLVRFFPFLNIQKIISIPNIVTIAIFLILLGTVLYFVNIIKNNKILLWGGISLLIFIFILTKNEFLSFKLSVIFRKLNNQSLNLATSNEIIWVGYSYFAFRIIHALIESNKRRGIDVSLKTYLIYLFYFPAFLAGPIEKLDNFKNQLSAKKNSTSKELILAVERIAIGLFQKFIIADTLAIISINNKLSLSINSSFWMWIIVLAYSLRIYFDFSGYTYIALGISMILGIKLPENFNKPLRSPTLTIFWNNWHITLTQWFRAYYFNPFTRYIKTKYKTVNQQILMGFMQISTLILIGLWHGINYNFLAWGAWNGIGIYIQNRISAFLLQKIKKGKPFWQISKLSQGISIILTFIFISLGWVWFALPSIDSSVQVFKVLFGRL